jgi:hypothetical protein
LLVKFSHWNYRKLSLRAHNGQRLWVPKTRLLQVRPVLRVQLRCCLRCEWRQVLLADRARGEKRPGQEVVGLAGAVARAGVQEHPGPAGLPRSRQGRRRRPPAAWNYPDGIKLIAEYWPLSSAVQVVSIMSADSIEKIMELFFEWDDVFDIDVYPAVSAEEGLRIGPEVFARLPRTQQHA